MNNVKDMYIVFHDESSLLCSYLVMEKSELLSSMSCFSDNDTQPIRLPEFITRKVFSDIIIILECENYHYIQYCDILYIANILIAADFLLINQVVPKLQVFVEEKLTYTNSFDVFKYLHKISYLHRTIQKCVDMIMTALESVYNNELYRLNSEDPYISKYTSMHVNEIRGVIFLSSRRSTLAKILFFKNWWKCNKDPAFKEEIFEIFEKINEDAAYIPRQHIIFMREIRKAFTN